MGRWFYSSMARKPNNPDERWEVGVLEEKFRFLQRRGHQVKLCRLEMVKAVLDDTLAIIEGWSRPDSDDCFVYVGKPEFDRREIDIEVPPPPGMLFLVFVLAGGTIDEWGWRQQSESDPNIPDGVEGRVIWRC